MSYLLLYFWIALLLILGGIAGNTAYYCLSGRRERDRRVYRAMRIYRFLQSFPCASQREIEAMLKEQEEQEVPGDECFW